MKRKDVAQSVLFLIMAGLIIVLSLRLFLREEPPKIPTEPRSAWADAFMAAKVNLLYSKLSEKERCRLEQDYYGFFSPHPCVKFLEKNEATYVIP